MSRSWMITVYCPIDSLVSRWYAEANSYTARPYRTARVGLLTQLHGGEAMSPKRVFFKSVVWGALFMALVALVGAWSGPRTQVLAATHAMPPISPAGTTFTPTPVPSCTPTWAIVNSP